MQTRIVLVVLQLIQEQTRTSSGAFSSLDAGIAVLNFPPMPYNLRIRPPRLRPGKLAPTNVAATDTSQSRKLIAKLEEICTLSLAGALWTLGWLCYLRSTRFSC